MIYVNALVKRNFWPSVGATFLFMVVTGVFNQLTGLLTRPVVQQIMVAHRVSAGGILIIFSTSVLSGPIYVVLIAGLYAYFLKLIRGQSASVGDVFSGFGPSLGPLVLLGWVQTFLVLTGVLFCLIPGVYLSVAWVFATPLIIDRHLGFWEAMELSRKMVNKHWFAVFGFLIVYGLVVMGGFIACCVGFFVTMPIGIAALMYGYESVFAQSQRQ